MSFINIREKLILGFKDGLWWNFSFWSPFGFRFWRCLQNRNTVFMIEPFSSNRNFELYVILRDFGDRFSFSFFIAGILYSGFFVLFKISPFCLDNALIASHLQTTEATGLWDLRYMHLLQPLLLIFHCYWSQMYFSIRTFFGNGCVQDIWVMHQLSWKQMRMLSGFLLISHSVDLFLQIGRGQPNDRKCLKRQNWMNFVSIV